MAARIHVGFLTAMLVSYGTWSIYIAISGRLWDYIIGGTISLIAAAGVTTDRRWARYAVYLLAVALTCGWLWYVWLALRVGYFARVSSAEGLLSLVPGLALMLLAMYCCYVAWRYVGGKRSPAT
jgi:hypothetical protein